MNLRRRTVLMALTLCCAMGSLWPAAASPQSVTYPNFKPAGRVMLDAASYQDDRNGMSSGMEVRRARIAVVGNLAERWSFMVEADAADEGMTVRDAWVMYTASPHLRVQAGNIKEPLTLEGASSSRYSMFLERSLADGMVPPRNLGAVVKTYWGRATALLGVFGQEPRDINEDDLEESESIGWIARLTATPLQGDRRLVHLGLGGRHRTPDAGDGDRVRFRAYSETHVDRTRLYDTGDVTASSFDQLVLEGAAVYGPLSIQSDHIVTRLNRDAVDAPRLNGSYVYVSWLATGESRPYEPRDGTFLGITPRRARGAVELAARYSTLDFNDLDVTGGSGHNWTLGANWYPNANTRFMLNYVITDHDDLADANGAFQGDDDFRVLQLRVQFHF